MIGINTLHRGDCLDLISQLPDNSIHAVVTSPPYAEQRKKLYGGISETDYPQWFTNIMSALHPKLTADGSVLVAIRSHVWEGVVSDYILRTRLMVRESGWNECEELIWYKPDAPPLGSLRRPRRTWENILWFSKAKQPYIDLKACGNQKSDRVGFQGSTRFGVVYKGTRKVDTDQQVISGISECGTKTGTSKVSDVFIANVSDIDKGIMHPAMYPVSLSNQLIATFSKEGDTILDPFVGAGTTLLSARFLKRNYIGFDISQEYIDIATERLKTDWKYVPSYASLDSIFE